jgi:hypothetical protein
MLRRKGFRAGLVGLFALAACALTSAPVDADDYGACAKFDNPLAYNACLAQQGPLAHGSKAAAPPRGDAAAHGSWTAHRRVGQTYLPPHARRGRMVLELTVGPPSAAARSQNRSR